MKDEFGGIIATKSIGLKSKMYSIKEINGKEINTAKGVNIATECNEFKDVLFTKKVIRHKMKRKQARKHKIGTYEITKISLSCFDDKRCVLDDGIHTLAYFHYFHGSFTLFFLYKKTLYTKKHKKANK